MHRLHSHLFASFFGWSEVEKEFFRLKIKKQKKTD